MMTCITAANQDLFRVGLKRTARRVHGRSVRVAVPLGEGADLIGDVVWI